MANLFEGGARLLRGHLPGAADHAADADRAPNKTEIADAQRDLFDPSTVRLVKYDAAKRALAEAHSIDEVKEIADKARAMQVYGRLAGDTELIDHATEIRKRAEFRAGELLREMREQGQRDTGQGGDRRSQSQPATVKLADMGITKSESSRWQATAKLPPDQKEALVENAKRQAKAKRKRASRSDENVIANLARLVRTALKRMHDHRQRRGLQARLHKAIDEVFAEPRSKSGGKSKQQGAKKKKKMKRTKPTPATADTANQPPVSSWPSPSASVLHEIHVDHDEVSATGVKPK